MADKRVKAERSKIKDFRQIPAPDLPSTGAPKKHRDKPWIVWERYSEEYCAEMSSWGRRPEWVTDAWRVRGRYEKEDVAKAAMEQFGRQYTGDYLEFRVRHREVGDE